MRALFLLILFSLSSAYPQLIKEEPTDTSLIWDLISAKKEDFKEFLFSPSKYNVQVIYTQISRNERNFPSFKTFTYNYNHKEYFYPASTVKLPAAIIALEKINELNIAGLTKSTALRIDSTQFWQTPVVNDTTSSNGLASIAHYIKKILLVSDNDAYNRLYEFLGQRYFNEKLKAKGLNDLRLVSRLSISLSPEQNACTNPITFYEGEKIIYSQPQICNEVKYPNQLLNIKQGIGYFRNDSLINEPKDFSNSNYISLGNLHEILKRIFFPETFSESQRFNLTESDYNFFYKYMSMFPRESIFPKYDSTKYKDNYVKFFMPSKSESSANKNIRIFNKVGQAYGYLIDNAYVVDFNQNVEFLLSAVIYVNEDQIFNDDKYEYDTIGFPFLANLGRIIYNFDLSRKREHIPDLSKFKLDYISKD
jgi:hypothetical protein